LYALGLRLATHHIDITQRCDIGWFDNNQTLIRPLTTEEQQNIDTVFAHTGPDSTAIAVSEAHMAMEYYRFADSDEAFSELSTAVLAHLYFVKVQIKPAEYDRMGMDEKKTWNISKMRTIRRYSKPKLIKSVVDAVRALLSVGGHLS
jgi:hypothetical protein